MWPPLQYGQRGPTAGFVRAFSPRETVVPSNDDFFATGREQGSCFVPK